ncbi:DNA-binding protein [Poseidonibacter parvus]|uniref:DNA-binding protein n=1 Tax=Poseidonibacter parvus TaxID=1850254 RepID=A0A1P8KPL4_9BACT|nr:KilA-N domain-containing protein [Poseidonibacter parvus]APW66488.1 DNA-binding protein [Poseidonibacter parvus]
MPQNKLFVKDITVSLTKINKSDFISLTDIARSKNQDEPKDVVKNWLRSKNTIEFLGLWETINNNDFKGVEFDSFKNEAGSNSFTLSPTKWTSTTNAIGLITKVGKNGGTFAHKDIAFEFASWVSAEFKLYLIKEFQRLKNDEIEKNQLGWDLKRNIAKINYKIHTDAIKENLIPQKITKAQSSFIYANEADILNVALFGITAKQWKEHNPKLQGNIRDYSSIEQLVVLSNMESMNAELIKNNIKQEERLEILNNMAITQLKSITSLKTIDQLEKK